MTGCVLDVAQCYAGIEGGGDEAVVRAVGADPFVDPGSLGEAFDRSVRGVMVHSLAVAVEEYWSAGSFTGVELDSSGGSWSHRHDCSFAALADDVEDVVASLETEIVDVGIQRF